jgi:sulfate adenylyltransferase subunit 2
MSRLKELENRSIYILRELHNKFKNPAILWSIGKDSTTMLWLCKKAFYGKIPFKIFHIDTGYKFDEIYKFRDKYSKEWDLNVIVEKNEMADKNKIFPENNKFECCNVRKTQTLKLIKKKYDVDAFVVGIRRDEHGIRNKERFFSPRDKDFKWNLVKTKDENIVNLGDSPFVSLQDIEFSGWDIFATDYGDNTDHVRVHPILDWSEEDIWNYIKQENIPTIELYFAKKGLRYRSIGCKCCSKPVISNADNVDKIIEELKKSNSNEREGRDQDKEDEDNMQKLRSLGYM